jgi:hypothetical protein
MWLKGREEGRKEERKHDYMQREIYGERERQRIN